MVIDYENLFTQSCLKHFKIGGAGGGGGGGPPKKKKKNPLSAKSHTNNKKPKIDKIFKS